MLRKTVLFLLSFLFFFKLNAQTTSIEAAAFNVFHRFATIANTCTTVSSGDWNNPSTWSCNAVPTLGDDVIISSGTVVTIANNSVCQSITINGSLSVSGTSNLDVYGSWVNDGSFNGSTGTVSFKGSGNNTIGGSAATAFYNIIVDKGTNVTSVLEANGTGAISNTGTLKLINGLFKATTGTFQFLSSTNITIPSTAGIWVNGATVNSVSNSSNGFSIISEGLVRISDGVFNVGTAAGNRLEMNRAGAGSITPVLEISGGTLNVSGRLFVNDYSSFNISGGTINVCTKGLSSGTEASFQISASSTVAITGGNIVFQNANSGTAGDVRIISGSGSKSVTGGTFQLGNSSSPAGSSFVVNSDVSLYNLTVFSSSVKASLGANLTLNNQLTLNGQLWLNDKNLMLPASATSVTGLLGSSGGMIVTNGNGEVKKSLSGNGSFLFPVGTVSNGTPEYSPVTLTYSGTAGVKVTNTKHPSNTNADNYLKRYWSINSSGITSASYDIAATYLATDIAGSKSNIAVGRYTSSWTKGGAVNSGTTTITETGVTDKSTSVVFTGITLSNPICNITGTNIICSNETTSFSADAVGNASYAWTGPSGFSPVTGQSTGTISIAGVYTVAIDDGMGGKSSCTRTLTVNPAPSLSGGMQASAVCEGSAATINLTGLVANSISTISYTIGSGATQTANVTANAFGNGSFSTPALTFANDGQLLRITNITITSSTPNCSQSFIQDINLSVNAELPVKVNISSNDADNTICAGESVTFTATPTNGGTAPIYQWKVNGGNAGTNSPTFTTSALGNGDVVTAEMTSNASPCATGSPATSNSLTVIVNPLPAITGKLSVCVNSTTALSGNGTPASSNAWTSSNTSIATVSSTGVVTGLTSGTAIITYTNSNSCQQTVSITVSALPTGFSVTGGGSYCAGGTGLPVGLSGSQTGVSYQLQQDGVNVGSAVTGTGSAINFGDQKAAGTYTVVATNTTTSCTESMAGGVTISINPLPTASAGSNSPVCASSTLNLTSSGGVSYSWTGPGGFSSTQQNPSRNAVTAADGGMYTVTVTDANGCKATTTTDVTITPTIIPSVVISATPGNNICKGTSVTFTANPTNGGTAPSYQWQVNGTNVGTNSATFSSSALSNTDKVTVIMTSSVTCPLPATATSNQIVMTVNDLVVPSVSISSSVTSICPGTSVTFTASPINGGSAPTYQWQVNGANAGTNSAMFTTAALSNGDAVTVTMTSNAACASPASVTSAAINITVNPAPVPAVSVSASTTTACAGTSITFSATPTKWRFCTKLSMESKWYERRYKQFYIYYFWLE